jgi:hypothetical protein
MVFVELIKLRDEVANLPVNGMWNRSTATFGVRRVSDLLWARLFRLQQAKMFLSSYRGGPNADLLNAPSSKNSMNCGPISPVAHCCRRAFS